MVAVYSKPQRRGVRLHSPGRASPHGKSSSSGSTGMEFIFAEKPGMKTEDGSAGQLSAEDVMPFLWLAPYAAALSSAAAGADPITGAKVGAATAAASAA